jgi:hypothetical protein
LGVDLLDWFRGVHAWPKLYRLLGRLPAEGHYKSALAMNMPYARRQAQREAEGRAPRPDDDPSITPLRYGPMEQRLDTIADMLQVLRSTLVAVNTDKASKVPKVHPAPRPKTALQIARAELERAELRRLAAQLLGGGGIPLN